MAQKEERSSLLAKKAGKYRGCCRGYKFVSIHSKGALVPVLLVSMWGFQDISREGKEIVKPYMWTIYNCVACLMFPVLGFYTDVRFGRHKTLVALAIVRVFLSAIPLPLKFLSHVHDKSSSEFEIAGIVYTILEFIHIPVSIWLDVITFTFGLDQLLDAPSSELSVFIHWRFFGSTLTMFIRYVLSAFVPPAVWNFGGPVISFLSQVVCLLSLLFCHRWLNLQPQVTNPLHLVVWVLHYAVKTSQPRRRSAFTYWQE